MSRLFTIVFFVFGSMFLAQTASAQYNPPLSPWLNLYNQNPGQLGGYLSNVKPMLDYNKQMQQFQQMQRNQTQMGQQLQQVMQPGSTGPSRDLMGGGVSGGRDTNVLGEPREIRSMSGAAGYRTYQHWYPGGLPQGGVPSFSTPRTGRRY
jgi:hypothetical protein